MGAQGQNAGQKTAAWDVWIVGALDGSVAGVAALSNAVANRFDFSGEAFADALMKGPVRLVSAGARGKVDALRDTLIALGGNVAIVPAGAPAPLPASQLGDVFEPVQDVSVDTCLDEPPQDLLDLGPADAPPANTNGEDYGMVGLEVEGDAARGGPLGLAIGGEAATSNVAAGGNHAGQGSSDVRTVVAATSSDGPDLSALALTMSGGGAADGNPGRSDRTGLPAPGPVPARTPSTRSNAPAGSAPAPSLSLALDEEKKVARDKHAKVSDRTVNVSAPARATKAERGMGPAAKAVLSLVVALTLGGVAAYVYRQEVVMPPILELRAEQLVISEAPATLASLAKFEALDTKVIKAFSSGIRFTLLIWLGITGLVGLFAARFFRED